MISLGVISDGLSRNLEQALKVLDEYDFEQAELQFIADKEVGDLSSGEIAEVKKLLERYNKTVSCISRHNFAGLPLAQTELSSSIYQQHFEKFKRCVAMAQELDVALVRVMSCRKEMILFGSHGADQWNVSKGAWEKLLSLFQPVVEYAQSEGITLVVETGNSAMITSARLAKRFIDELGSSSLKVLWDPANSLYCNENPLEGYEFLRGGYLAHLHLKDVRVDIPAATVRCCAWGSGQMGEFFEPLAAKLKQDNYEGGISYESVYRPDGGDFVDGFYKAAAQMRRLFQTEKVT